MSFIGETFTEELTHEGVMDIFKNTKIQTTPDDITWLAFYGDKEFIQKGLSYLNDKDDSIDVNLDDIKDLINFNTNYLKGINNKIIVIDKTYDGRFQKKEDKDEWANSINTDVIKIVDKGIKDTFKYFYTAIDNGLKTYTDKKVTSKLNELKDSLTKVENKLTKNTKLVSKDTKITTETGVEIIDNVTVESAIDTSTVLGLIQLRDELDTLSANITHEGAFTFLTKVKEFFINTVTEIKNKLTSIFKNEPVTKKYQEDKIKELKSLNYNCTRIGSLKFTDIESIELPIMMGMKYGYTQTTFELSNLITAYKNAQVYLEDMNSLLSNLISDTNDMRISNDPKLYKYNKEITFIKDKTTSIINEITEIKQPTDIKTVSKLFNNTGSVKDINNSYISLYQETIKFDLDKYVLNINRMSSLLTVWINGINDRNSEVKYSNNVLTLVQENVGNIAHITTNLGIYLAYLNQTSAFFITGVNKINQNV